MREVVAPWLGWVDTLTGLEAKTRRTFGSLDGLLERVIADHRRSRRPGPGAADDDDDHLDVNEMDNDAGLRLDTDNIKAIILVVHNTPCLSLCNRHDFVIIKNILIFFSFFLKKKTK